MLRTAYNAGVIAIFIILLILLVTFAFSGWSGAPWVPARRADIETLLDDVHLKADELYIELGCGDGRLLVAVAKRGATAVGYEINPLLWLIATIRTIRFYPRVHVKLGNFWRANISQADVVMTFLVPRTMPNLARTAKELRP